MKIHFISISLTFTSCIVITFSFSYHHTFTTSWLRQKKISLLIIKLISQLRSLRHDLRVKIFFFFITYYVHYAMIKRKPFFFHFGITFNTPLLPKKKFDFYWTTTLTTLRLWKNCSFLFHWDVHYGNIFLHDLSSLTTSLTCWKNSQTV